MTGDALTVEEVTGWYTPKQVLDLLPAHWNPYLKRQEIAHRIQAGTIQTAAIRMITDGNEYHAVPIVLGTWKGWGFLANDGSAENFWEGGSFQKFVTPPHGFAAHQLFQFFGVRLRPNHVASMLVELGLGPSPPPLTLVPLAAAASERKHLPAAERKRFAQVYAEVFGSEGTEARAFQAVTAAYPEKFVPRDPFLTDFRAIRGKQVPGRKGKTE
jgi:hypothetical protein